MPGSPWAAWGRASTRSITQKNFLLPALCHPAPEICGISASIPPGLTALRISWTMPAVLRPIWPPPRMFWDLVRAMASSPSLPDLYFSCGTEDPIAYKNFKKFRKYAEEAGLKAEFEEVPGFSHEWRFWDRTIQKALCRFLPDEEGHGNKF